MGPACYIGDSLPLALYLVYKYAEDSGAALLANANLGGECCYRGALVGALVGAHNGLGNDGLKPPHLVSGLPSSLHRDIQIFTTALFDGTIRQLAELELVRHAPEPDLEAKEDL